MAAGKKCQQCDGEWSMFARTEKDYPAGTEVVYQCPNCKSEEKVFEDNR
jgi:Zn finger protein HypA/HybF involved in hydrogenase expression